MFHWNMLLQTAKKKYFLQVSAANITEEVEKNEIFWNHTSELKVIISILEKV